MNKTIGQRIKDRRKELKISADELALRLKKDRSTIYRYEKGDIENVPIDLLKPIADALEMTPSELMGWSPENIETASNDYSETLEDLSGLDAIIEAEEMDQLKKWKEAIGNVIFTDEEFEQILDFSKFILSKRKDK